MPPDRVVGLQGWYYLVTGAWPLVWMWSFELVTGRKRDRWLVRTVALLLCAIGASLVRAAGARRVTPEVRLVAAGTAGSLALIDIVYVLRGTLRPVYLLDAVMELLFVGRGLRSRGR